MIRLILLAFLFVSTTCLADEDPAVVETAKRMNWSIETVRALHITGCASGRPNEMAICGAYRFVQADMKLNQVYTSLLSELGTKVAKEKLIAAQRSWVAYRDKACYFEADGYKNSRDLSAVVFSCKAEYTTERMMKLERFIGCDGGYGCPGVE
jgi:uncharacterized protein YecT (DUF1311 family)|nr:lysozyme inhibitor LprI family protein [uncultured Undibacterium sp.]